MGDFVDLCRGPHLYDLSPIKAFSLQKIAGAYWKGNQKEKMLTRIYGTAFWTKEELKAHLKLLEEAKKRDHSRVGKEMRLFKLDENIGQGLPLLTERGTVLMKILQNYVEGEEKADGYMHTMTPFLAKSDLYKISGHWQHYREGMFIIENDGEPLALRPMTCPFHFSLYNAERRSYRELPVRYAETSTLFRNEDSGEMHGLIRVRQFTLADGHIILQEDKIEEEFIKCLRLLEKILTTIGLKDHTYRLSKWDPADKGEKYIDDSEAWEKTEAKMKKIMDENHLTYVEAVGEAAFYGPKLDIQMKNVYGKEDTLLTIQIDFALPKRFKMTYIDENDQEKTPYVIHRASIGCYERTMAMLIEKHAGKLPFWMAVDQVAILAITSEVHDYCQEIYQKLIGLGMRAKMDLRQETLGKKIRSHVKLRTPILLTIGKQEQSSQTVSLRTYHEKVRQNIPLQEFIETCHSLHTPQTIGIALLI